MQVAHRARATVEGHREAMRFVADALNEEQRRVVRRERDRLGPIACEQQLFLLRDADRHEVAEPELLQRGIRGRELSFSTVDDQEIRKRPALLEKLPAPSLNDFMHGGKVVL